MAAPQPNEPSTPVPSTTSRRAAGLLRRIAKNGMAPLWKVMNSVVTKEPVTRCVPAIWHFDDVKRLVMEAGG